MSDEKQGPGPVREREEFPPIDQDAPLREEDVLKEGAVLDDRVQEDDGEGA